MDGSPALKATPVRCAFHPPCSASNAAAGSEAIASGNLRQLVAFLDEFRPCPDHNGLGRLSSPSTSRFRAGAITSDHRTRCLAVPIPRWFSVLLVMLVMAAPLSAADLTKLDRKPGKEPVYQGKPRYCLLVFGAATSTRVLVVDGGQALF